MSRSRHQKSCGRGCWVCGDAGQCRKDRERAWQRADEGEGVREYESESEREERE